MPDSPPSSAQPPWRPSTPAVEAEMFEDLIAGPAVIVHFWAPWNPYDKQLDANLAQLRPAFAKQFRFYSANTDNTAFTPIVDAHHVAALPALICFANGRSRGRFHGVETPEALKAFLEEMAKPPAR